MKKILPLAAALLLTDCQQTAYTGNPEYREYATSDLELLQMGTRGAASAEIYCRIETAQAGEPEIRRYPLSAEELQQVKECLKKTMPAPKTEPEALSRRWKAAGIELRLLTINGRTLCTVSRNTICSYSDAERYGETLLCLPDMEMSVLNALPTLKIAKEYKRAEEEYARHCRLRAEEAGKIRAASEKTTDARVHLESDANEEYLHLEDEELEQLKAILSTAMELPAMTRKAWDTPETHCMPLPPPAVHKELELLDDEDKVIYSIPLNYNYFAAGSAAEAFTAHECQGEVAALPDEQLQAFQSLPFRSSLQEKEAELLNN